MAQDLAKIYLEHNWQLPKDVDEILNPSDLDTKLYNLLQHEFWEENSIPVYDKSTPHFSDPDDPNWFDISLDPDDPDSFLIFFWLDKDLAKILLQTNRYIDKKNKLKTKYQLKIKSQLKKKGKNKKN